MSIQAIKIHPDDNVAVLLAPASAGAIVNLTNGDTITARQEINTGHKIALVDLATGQPVIKYANPIGLATSNIKAGDWVHSHNLKTQLSGELEYKYSPKQTNLPEADEKPTFMGYLRSDGKVGIRNDIWIIPTVGCVNQIATQMEDLARDNSDFAHLDSVKALTHPFGCSQLGADHQATKRILADLARHPNAGGVLVIGLGCENLTMAEFQAELGDIDSARCEFVICQEVEDEFAACNAALLRLAERLKTCKRTEQSLDKLFVGLKCGGSDAFSGITANPLVGAFSDWLIARGGSSVLTEVPEMFGAEHLLMQRCESEAVFSRLVEIVNNFKAYFIRHNQVVYENPSPGNKAGGITTLEEKSLGCTQKGGVSPVVDVLNYGDQLRRPGLSLLEGPGNDIVSITALTAAGCQLVLFTTGRGTPLGGAAPTIKIASNEKLAKVKKNWIDFDASAALRDTPMLSLAANLGKLVLATASGQLTCSERAGQHEIALFHDGVTL